MTPSVSPPKDQAREDERVEKANQVIGYLNVYRDENGHLETGCSDPYETVEDALEFNALEFGADHVGVFALVPAPSVSPSPADPVRAALEEHRARLFEPGDDQQQYRFGDSGTVTLTITNAQARAALSVSTPTGEGEERDSVRVALKALDAANVAAQSYSCSVHVMRHVDSARAVLAHPPQGGERDGWKLVSIEPTEEQINAGTAALRAVELSTGLMIGGFNLPRNVARHLAVSAWKAMVPTAPTSASESSGEEA